jgi:hypothetical protein
MAGISNSQFFFAIVLHATLRRRTPVVGARLDQRVMEPDECGQIL